MTITDPRPSPNENRTVLVVEDNVLVRIMIAEELREAGMRVIEAGNADEALLHFAAGNGIDFVFADVELPGSMNGFELVRRLRANFPDLKALMTSGRLPAHTAASIAPFVPKPYNLTDVITCILAALSGPVPE
jgi:two-component system, response regulator PdtaR